MYLTCTHAHSCRSSSTLDLIANDSIIVDYDFECPINQVKYEGEEYFEIPRELAKLLLQEEKAIQPHEESVKVINLGTETNKKEVKIDANLKQCQKQISLDVA